MTRLTLNDNFKFSKPVSGIFDAKQTFLHNIDMQVQFTPKLMVTISGNIGVTTWEQNGDFRIVLVNINEKIRSFTEIHFGP